MYVCECVGVYHEESSHHDIHTTHILRALLESKTIYLKSLRYIIFSNRRVYRILIIVVLYVYYL